MAFTAFAALPLAACMGTANGPQTGFAAPPPPPAIIAEAPASSGGAIYQASNGYSNLVTGTRARSLGDMVTIVLVESTSTSKSSAGQTQRGGSFGLTPPTSGPFSFLNPNALNAGSEGTFNGGGNAAQQSRLTGNVTVTIAAVYPNGTAEVIGEKQMSLSQGEEWVQFAGRIRLIDIDGDNTLPSSRVANARIIYTGDGAVQQASRPGWLSRFFNIVSPF
jgi:flagellar L-ring protein precursor FlgH